MNRVPLLLMPDYRRFHDLRAMAGLLLFFAAIAGTRAAYANKHPDSACVSVTDFLPDGYVVDGSVSYQSEVQAALAVAGEARRNVVFAPIKYFLDDAKGLSVSSGVTLLMNGATFILSPDIRDDGQTFLGEGVRDVCFCGGTIIGQNHQWPAGTNVRGIHLTGRTRQVRIKNMVMRDLSSNGVGVFGPDAANVARDLWLVDTTINNCCNVYGDYQAGPGELRGPEKGSDRKDQGSVALYFVEDFVVRGCRFEASRSDGTHFFRCRNGQFTDNRVCRAAMGGYFVETCEHVLAANNVIRNNGSRGVTIERGSRACTLVGNTVEGSGREGLWMPDSSNCVATNNLFLRNGRKDNGQSPHQIWDANVTINESNVDPSNSPVRNCVISHNVFDTGKDQIAAVRVHTSESVRGIFIQGNVLLGENQRILVEGRFPEHVRLVGNLLGKVNRD